ERDPDDRRGDPGDRRRHRHLRGRMHAADPPDGLRRAAHQGTALHLNGGPVTTTTPSSVRRILEPNYPNFPAAEIAARCRRMRGLMAEEGIDLLLLTEKENVVYFSGLSSCAWVQKGVVPAVVLLHVDTDEPVMLLPDFWLGTAEKTTWCQDFVLH